MPKYKRITRNERLLFMEIFYVSQDFSLSVQKRYHEQGFSLPFKVKCLVWAADCVADIIRQYTALCMDESQKTLHRDV